MAMMMASIDLFECGTSLLCDVGFLSIVLLLKLNYVFGVCV